MLASLAHAGHGLHGHPLSTGEVATVALMAATFALARILLGRLARN